MIINWSLMGVLFCVSVPGVCIAMPRLIGFLLASSTNEVQKRLSRLVVVHTLFMVLVLSVAGDVLSLRTGLHAPLLDSFLQGTVDFDSFLLLLWPVFICALTGLLVFLALYYGVVSRILDKHSLQVMTELRHALGLGGCVLYGGIVEEILARWGLMNLSGFFLMAFIKQNNLYVVSTSILLSGLIFAVGQVPAYLAAGCVASRRFIYSIVLLSLWQSFVFGFVFWQYGLVAAMLAHVLFHVGWSIYESLFRAV
ncbi:MAG: CPBP family intramembrane glutamate endopeptidase [Legionellales bacterium]